MTFFLVKLARLMRLHKPIGFLLLLWPTIWSMLLASNGQLDLRIVSLLILGAFITRSGGCIINDLLDARYDGKVARTQMRPLANKQLSKTAASILLTVHLIAAMLVAWQFSLLTIKLAGIALLLVSIYPLCKRFTHLAQWFLGFTFSFSVLITFSAVTDSLPEMAWWLYAINVLWVVAYDTIYALMDKQDDMKLGLHSMAILLSAYVVHFIVILHSIIFALFISFAFYYSLSSVFVCTILAALLIFCYQWFLLYKGTKSAYLAAFNSNATIGFLLTLGLLDFSYLLSYL